MPILDPNAGQTTDLHPDRWFLVLACRVESPGEQNKRRVPAQLRLSEALSTGGSGMATCVFGSVGEIMRSPLEGGVGMGFPEKNMGKCDLL